MSFSEQDTAKLLQFLNLLDAEVTKHLSPNMAASFYGVASDFVSSDEEFEMKIASFFSGMPDKHVLLIEAIGNISMIRSEIMKIKGDAAAAPKQALEDFFTRRIEDLSRK